MSDYTTPRSPRDEVQGVVYLARLCNKVRLHAKGELHPDYQPNLGIAMDLWTCQFFHVAYQDLVEQLLTQQLTDEDLFEWLCSNHYRPSTEEIDWWNSYMRNRGFRDDFAELLQTRKEQEKSDF